MLVAAAYFKVKIHMETRSGEKKEEHRCLRLLLFASTSLCESCLLASLARWPGKEASKKVYKET
jgi:hypothetical protein